jgi:endonuclease YncB( thermonuclease family)
MKICNLVQGLAVTLLSTLLSVSAVADTLFGKVVGISDGDTITVLITSDEHKRPIKVRLAEIDAPEKKQPFGNASKQALSDLIYGRAVEVETGGGMSYGRYVAQVYLDQKWINGVMVESGNAWVYPKYAKTEMLYTLQKSAQEKGLGLWALQADQRTPPWEWRHSR